MRMIYLSNARFPSRDAVTIQQMQVAEAFAGAGVELTFIRPFYFELAKYSSSYICDYYGVSKNFKIRTLPSLLSLSKPTHGVDTGYELDSKKKKKIPKIGGASLMASTWLYIRRQLLAGQFNSPTIIYSRNLNAATVFLHQREKWFRNKPIKIFVEAHALVQRPTNFFDYIIHHCDGIVSITHSLKSAIIKKYKIPAEEIFVAPDGVRSRWLTQSPVSKQEARLTLNIPKHYEKVVLYSGAFSPGKGVEILIRAASEFDERVLFCLLGGTQRTINELKQMTKADRLSNVNFAGFVPPKAVSLYQQAADVLILPNSADYKLKDFTSPLKLFEYMAAQRPIVASDLPVFREVLRHEKNSLLVTPSDPKALANGIRRIFADNSLASEISRKAREEVEDYSWDNRARNILQFLGERSGWSVLN